LKDATTSPVGFSSAFCYDPAANRSDPELVSALM
jgi:hypothetical protein